MKPQRTQTLHRKWPLWMALALAGLALAVTPSHAQQLYQTHGPMTAQAPGPVFDGSKGGGTYGYSIKSDFARVKSFGFVNGETLKGKPEWTTASAADAQAPATSDSSAPQANLAAAWDLVYGQGYYAAHVAGNKVLQGTFTGDKGAVLHVQSLDKFMAVGVDNQGNLYKIVW
jgi:hypothetical protein